MADKKYQKKKIQDTENSNFGNYQESTGGGHPFEKGNSNTRTTRENGKIRKDENQSSQPRTDDGKFTYNSVNGKDLKYGEKSRGKTVNPLLTGGENGIKIEDVESEFSNKSGSIWDKYKDKWYTKGGEMALQSGKKFTTRVAAKAIWEVAKMKYDVVKGEFTDESSTFDESKKGKSSLDEASAKQKAQASGEEQAVIDSNTGGIKAKGDDGLPKQPEKAPEKAPETQPTPVIPSVPTQPEAEKEETVQDAPVATAPKQTGIKYGEEEIDKVKEFFKNKFGNNPEKLEQLLGKLEALSPEKLDETIDMWISKGVDFGFGGNSSELNEGENEDSDTIKKIKGMGFNG